MSDTPEKTRGRARKALAFAVLAFFLLLFVFLCLCAGSSKMSAATCVKALFGGGTPAENRIMQNIRLPRTLAAIIAGAGLSLAGLMMQTTLNNRMASPSTLGVTNAAVFGANLSIIVFAGGRLMTGGNLQNYASGANPFATSVSAFLFAALSTLLMLALCRTRRFRADVVVLAGIAVGTIWTAATTVLQFFATDVGLSAAVIWSFGDLGRATFKTDLIMAAVVLAGALFFFLMSWRCNALLGGDQSAAAHGVNVRRLRFFTLLVSSLITAVCVSFLGTIGFVGIICPHIAKLIFGEDHRLSIPSSALTGSLLLLFADTLARSAGQGTALPAGAVTALLGAPFFLALVFFGKGGRRDA